MNNIIFIISIILLSIAHYIKIIRQSQFIEIYERPPKDILSKSLSITFILNLIFPFKIGNIFRIIYTGKHLKNGKSFSFATIIVDILLDFFTITIFYCLFSLFNKELINNTITYLSIVALIVVACILMIILKKQIKKIILSISCIFNDRIQLNILKTSWYTIISFKDMFKRINKGKLIVTTLLSITCYLSSYYLLVFFLQSLDFNISFMKIFEMLYGSNNIIHSSIYVFYKYFDLKGLLYLLIYVSLPIIIIYISSYFYKKHPSKSKKSSYIELLPHINQHDRLVFLNKYFNAEKSNYINSYIDINRDVSIIQDYSAGSNATTMLCRKENKNFYRKYSIGKDAQKLYDQVEWIEEHKSKLELTEIIKVQYKDDICLYDMPYIENAVTCFNYVHTMPFEKSWNILKTVIDDLNDNLHSVNRRKSDKSLTELYIDNKVLKNIEIIEQAPYIKPLMEYEYIYINGKKYHNLKYYKKKYLNKEYLMEIFKNDEYSDIHGDFTIENIVCLKDKKNNKKPYYIIDPNTGNIHDSPYLDYAKLLQSIHGGYEFLMNTNNVTYYDNQIEFLFTKSNVYYKLFEKVIGHLENKFGKEALKSIFYHEVIHWLRLLPYKINKIGDRSLLFYAGFIMVMNDIEKRYKK